MADVDTDPTPNVVDPDVDPPIPDLDVDPDAPPTPDAPPAPVPTPPKIVDDAATRAALSKANREARERRQKITELEAKLADLEAANATEAERAILTARKEAADARDAALRPAVVRANARASLAAAGCSDKDSQALLMRMLDPAGVEIDADGEVSGGLDEQIDALKASFPEKFAPAVARVPSARQVDAGNKQPPAVPKTATEQLAARLAGGKNR